MICPTCDGKRLQQNGDRLELCPKCGGLGIVHCRDGQKDEPDTEIEPKKPYTPEPTAFDLPPIPGDIQLPPKKS